MAKHEPRFEDIKPGLASRRAPALAVYEGAQRRMWLWIALAVFGVVVSVATFVVSEGGVVVVWVAPMLLGLIQAIRTAPEVREAKQELDAIT